jgi:uncharacterized protein (TIGR00725 family)
LVIESQTFTSQARESPPPSARPRNLVVAAPDSAIALLQQRLQQRQLGLCKDERALRQPVAIVGPRDATAEQLACARRLGALLGRSRVPVLCGGKGGVMEAASLGVQQSGGIVIGLLPEDDDSQANRYVTVALPTGMGISRNALIARACVLMIAVGGGLGTMSEMALALQMGKSVLAIHGAPKAIGAEVFNDENVLAQELLNRLLRNSSKDVVAAMEKT